MVSTLSQTLMAAGLRFYREVNMTDYGLLAKMTVRFVEVDAFTTPVLSNASALLWDALDDTNCGAPTW